MHPVRASGAADSLSTSVPTDTFCCCVICRIPGLHSVVITVDTVEIAGLEMRLGTRITAPLRSSKKQELPEQ